MKLIDSEDLSASTKTTDYLHVFFHGIQLAIEVWPLLLRPWSVTIFLPLPLLLVHTARFMRQLFPHGGPGVRRCKVVCYLTYNLPT